MRASLYGRLWRFDPDVSRQNSSPRYNSTALGVIMDLFYATLEVPSSVFGIALRGTKLIVAGIDGVLTIFDISKMTSALPPIVHQIVHPASILAMDVTGDGVDHRRRRRRGRRLPVQW